LAGNSKQPSPEPPNNDFWWSQCITNHNSNVVKAQKYISW